MNLSSPKKISDVIGATSRVYMELLGHLGHWEFSCRVYMGLVSVDSGSFWILGLWLSGYTWGLSLWIMGHLGFSDFVSQRRCGEGGKEEEEEEE